MESTQIVTAVAQVLVFLSVTLLGGRRLQKLGGATFLSTLVQQLKQAKVVDLDGDGQPDSVEVLVRLLQGEIAKGVKAGMGEVEDRLHVLETSIEGLTDSLEKFVPEAQERLAAHSAAIEDLRAEVQALKEAG